METTEAAVRLAVYDDARRHILRGSRRFVVLYGGAGSGKSVEIAYTFKDKAFSVPNRRILALRKVARTCRESVFQQFKECLINTGEWGEVAANQQQGKITFPNDSEIICTGLDDPEKIKSIAGITDIWMEEATEFEQSDFKELNRRLRGKASVGGCFALSFNPVPCDWIQTTFIEQRRPSSYVLRTTVYDNPLAGEVYTRELEAEDDPILRAIYLEGRFAVDKRSIIFPEYELIDELPDKGVSTYGIDFGFNDPMAVMEVKIHDKADAYIHEHLYASNMTTSDLIAWLESSGIPKEAALRCDSAEPDRIQELCNAGWNAHPAKKGPGSINAGISTVNGLNLHITRSSVNTIKESKLYKWKQDKDGNRLDVPIDKFNHAWDGVRYAVTGFIEPPNFIYRSLQ